MEYSFQTLGTNTYFNVEVGCQDEIDSMGLGMLTNNKIHGLAQTLFTQNDDKKYIKYNVSSKVSVSQFFSGAVNKKRLIGVFSGIVNAMLSAEDYMLDTRTIMLDLDYIFTDVSTCETVLICLPFINISTENVDMGMFFRNIMFNTKFDQMENCEYVARIINYLNSTPSFSLVDFKKLLEEIADLDASKTLREEPKKDKPVVTVTEKPGSSVRPVMQPIIQPVSSTTTVIKQEQVPVVKAESENKKVVIPVQMPQNYSNSSGSQDDEKKMSFFYLMQHYNKENAAAYKAQKDAKKKDETPSPKKKEKEKRVKKKNADTSNVNSSAVSFAVPGQAVSEIKPLEQQTIQQPVIQQPVVSQPISQSAIAAQVKTQQPQIPTYTPIQVQENFGETTVLGRGGIGETTVLSAVQNPAQMIAPHLIRLKNNEKISLNKPVFRVGKERSYVDYFIGDNTAISRSHANFITRDGAYFVVDTNSTNHTFVNGQMIQSNEEVSISHGDKVRLANEDFEFKLY